MSTATAYSPRPTGTQTHLVTLKLVPAIAEDLKYLSGYDATGKEIQKLRIGMIYWLYSHAKNRMEPIPYMISETTDPQELKEYLDAGSIFISRYPFKN